MAYVVLSYGILCYPASLVHGVGRMPTAVECTILSMSTIFTLTATHVL